MSNAVRAGRAQVELTLLDRTQQGLRRAAARLKGFSMSIAAVGGTMLAGAGALAAPLIAATREFASSGDVFAKLSERTGMSAETLSALGFAAEQSDVSITELEAGIRGMQRSLYNLSDGAKEAVDAYSELGLSQADLENLSPEDQFMRVTDALSKIADPTHRAGLAMKVFGKAGTTMLPMLKDGEQGIRALMQQAGDLGLIISTEQAAEAARLGDAMNALGKSAKGAVFQSVGALAPLLSRLFEGAAAVVSVFTAWVKENQWLAVTVAKIAAGLAVAGGAMLAIGGVGTALAMILTGLSAGIGMVGSTIGVLMSPFVLLPALLLAAGVGFLHFTGQLGTVMQMAQDVGGGMLAFLRETVGAMGQALMGGDLALAGQIMFTSLDVAWQKGTLGLRQGWIEFWAGISQVMDGVVTGLRQVWIGFTTGLASYLLKVWENVQNLLGALAKIEGMVFGDGVISSLADALTIDVDGTIATLKEDQSRKSDAVDAARAARETERANQLTADLAETENQLAALQAERAKLLAEGNATETLPAVAALLGKIQATEQGLATAPPAVTPDPAAGVAAAGKIAGTFSSAAAGRMGLAVNDPGKQTAKHTRAMAKTLVAMEKRMGRGEGLTWGA